MLLDLQRFCFKQESKMSRGTLEYMLQMSAVQLKALLNEAWTFLLGDSLETCHTMSSLAPWVLWSEVQCEKNPLPYYFYKCLKVLDQLENLTPI